MREILRFAQNDRRAGFTHAPEGEICDRPRRALRELGSRVCGDEGFFASPFEAQGKLRVTEGLDSRMHGKEQFAIGPGVLSGGWVPACAGMAEGSRLRVVTPR